MDIINENLNSQTPELISQEVKRPCVFDYVDYRVFLQDFIDYFRSKNSAFSASAFIQKCGMGANSRGYFGLIVKGKRNLTYKTVQGFSITLKLSDKEGSYFEALVFYNQSKTAKDKAIYLAKLEKYNKGKNNPVFELLSSQYNYFSNWYYVAIRELVGLDDFQNDIDYIFKMMRKKVSRKNIKKCLEDLIKVGLLAHDNSGELVQVDELVSFSDNSFNYTVVNSLHSQFLERATESLEEDEYDERSASCVVISTNSKNLSRIREEIKSFRELIMNKYAVGEDTVDSVLNLGIQLHQITPVKTERKRK
jgi:uncharacterized protein (TIGR02147 family)